MCGGGALERVKLAGRVFKLLLLRNKNNEKVLFSGLKVGSEIGISVLKTGLRELKQQNPSCFQLDRGIPARAGRVDFGSRSLSLKRASERNLSEIQSAPFRVPLARWHREQVRWQAALSLKKVWSPIC